jgi:hypothetical protein
MYAKNYLESAKYLEYAETYPHYAEEGQDLPIKFQIVNTLGTGTYSNFHGPVQCRDFLGDFVSSRKLGIPLSIYGFSVDAKKWVAFHESHFGDTGFWELKVTFPKNEYKQNFLKNSKLIFECFYFTPDYLQPHITQFLNKDLQNVLHVSFHNDFNPVGMSLYTFLIKVASYDLQNYPEIVEALTEKDILGFIKHFTSIYNNKESRYFSRIDPNMWQYLEVIVQLSCQPSSMIYLDEHKNSTSYLHNYSGFFSQFNSHKTTYDGFASVVGTALTELGEPPFFQFKPLSSRERERLHWTSFNYKNDIFTFLEDKLEKYQPAYKKISKAPTVNIQDSVVSTNSLAQFLSTGINQGTNVWLGQPVPPPTTQAPPNLEEDFLWTNVWNTAPDQEPEHEM